MKVRDGLQVAIFYRITTDDGLVVDQVLTDDPFTYRHGRHQIPSSIEGQLTGLAPRQTVEFTLPPTECFGEAQASRRFEIPIEGFPFEGPVRCGSGMWVETPDGPLAAFVSEVLGDRVVLDGNDALAGLRLHFHIGIADVRPPRPDDGASSAGHGMPTDDSV